MDEITKICWKHIIKTLPKKLVNKKRMLTEKQAFQLHQAIRNMKNVKAKSIIDIMEDVNDIIMFGDTALFTASRHNNIEIVKYLIELGANVNQQNDNHFTPLFYPSFDIMKVLVDAGADINYITEHGETALSNTCILDRLEEVKYLISLGVDVNAGNGFALYKTIDTPNNSFEICKELIKAESIINFIDKFNGQTSLHIACHIENKFIIELLLDNNADEKIKNIHGKIPMELTENKEIKEFMKNYNSTKFILK